MDRTARYLVIAAVFLSLAALTGSGDRGKQGQPRPVLSTFDTLPHAQHESPAHGNPVLKPGRKFDNIDRPSFPGVGGQAGATLPVDWAVEPLPDAPPSPKHLAGVFHRYRPRDPTLS